MIDPIPSPSYHDFLVFTWEFKAARGSHDATQNGSSDRICYYYYDHTHWSKIVLTRPDAYDDTHSFGLKIDHKNPLVTAPYELPRV